MRRFEALRRTTQVLLSILAIAMPSAAPAQVYDDAETSVTPWLADEPHVVPSSAPERDGFVPVAFTDGFGTDKRAIVDERFAGPIARDLGEKVYGFSYAMADVDGDGADDLILAMRVVGDVPFGEGAGAPTWLYVYDDGDYRLVGRERGIVVGVRPRGDGGGSDVSFSSEEGYVSLSPAADGTWTRKVVPGR